jgi:DMSO/TMAO reductase YedYZ molybdopterin-dependent catalytic subunit
LFAQAPVVLTVTGDFPMPLKLTADDLAKMPRQTVTVDEPDGSQATYDGVPLVKVLKRAGAPLGSQLREEALASYLIAKAKDGYQVVFTLAEVDPQFANQSILLADRRNGAALPSNQGPLRLEVGNDKVGARAVRLLESIQFVRLAK